MSKAFELKFDFFLLVKKVISFFYASFIGVTLDLLIFKICIAYGFNSASSNMLSSSIAICSTYVFVSKHTFKRNLSFHRGICFFFYYILSIFTFSYVILFIVNATEWQAFICKIVTLPLSFLVNFMFSHLIIGDSEDEK